MFQCATTEPTIVDDPNSLTAFFKKLIFLNAAELIAILSAPAFKALLMSFKLRIPPPTVIGTNISLDAVLIIFNNELSNLIRLRRLEPQYNHFLKTLQPFDRQALHL